jgi:DNA transposition AAA+ family ATPase
MYKAELEDKLIKTDYIANKLAEAVSKYISTGDNTDVLLLREKYALELINREQWRKEIDKLQQELKINETKS